MFRRHWKTWHWPACQLSFENVSRNTDPFYMTYIIVNAWQRETNRYGHRLWTLICHLCTVHKTLLKPYISYNKVGSISYVTQYIAWSYGPVKHKTIKSHSNLQPYKIVQSQNAEIRLGSEIWFVIPLYAFDEDMCMNSLAVITPFKWE